MKNISKFLSLTLCTMLVVSMFCSPVSISAAGGLEITTPANGSTVSYDLPEFEFSLPANTDKIIVALDGKSIDAAAGGSVTLDGPLTLGKHTLELSAIYTDGTAEKVTSEFTAAVIPSSTVIDFEHVTPQTYTSSDDAFNAIKSLNLINGGIYNTTNKGEVAVESDATYGNVLKIKTTTARMLAGGAYVHIHSNPTIAADHTATNTTVNSGKVGLEFDACLNVGTSDPTQLTLTAYDAATKYFGGINLAVNNKILDTHTIDPGWYNFSLVFDLDSKEYSGIITDTSSGTKYTIAPTTLTTSTGASKISYYRLGARINAGKEVAFDNIKTGLVGNYTGADEIYFESLADSAANSDGFVDASVKPVARDVSKMQLKVSKTLDSTTVTPANISVVAGGQNIPVTSAVYDETKGTITLTLNNSGITTNGESYVSLSESIKFKGSTTAVGVKSRNPFSLTDEGFRIKSVDFKKGSSALIMADQLLSGDKVKAQIAIQNIKQTSEQLTAVLIVKSGDKFLSLTAKDITATADTANYPVEVESPAITTADNISASVIFVDNLKNALYIDSYHLK